jgi:hypothetical protein
LNVPLLKIPLKDAWWTSMGYTNNQKRENLSEIDKRNALKTALDTSDWSQSFTMPDDNENLKKKTPAEKASDLWTRVRDKAKKLSASLGGANDLVYVQKVFERFGKLPDLQSFASRLRSAIKSQIESGSLPIDIVEILLIGKLTLNTKKKLESSEATVQLAFDIDNGDTVYRRVTRTALEDELEAQDIRAVGNKSDGDSGKVCAYGTTEPLQNSAFPKLQLPIVAEKGTSLVSMFSEAPANTRYTLTDSAIVPVGQVLRPKWPRHCFGPLPGSARERRGEE